MSTHESTLLPRWSQQDWMRGAACAGRTELFFPPAGERPQARVRREATARTLCANCPVADPCRVYARVHREHGFWGGESEDERILAGYVPPHAIGISRLRRAG
jgi:WhiB family redox-sensing transcriptional regulator